MCSADIEDDGRILRCPQAHEPALLLAEYEEQSFRPDPDVDGIYRFHEWLPASRLLPTGGTVVYRSKALNRMAGLSNLWVAFNGYWPERGATLETATFKELEAWAVRAASGRNRRGDGDRVGREHGGRVSRACWLVTSAVSSWSLRSGLPAWNSASRWTPV